METTDVGIGSMGEGDIPDSGDFYAPGDARIPKVLGAGKRKKKKRPFKRSFKEWVNEAHFVDNAAGWVYVHRDGSFHEVTHTHMSTLTKIFPEIVKELKKTIKNFSLAENYDDLVEYSEEFIENRNIWFLLADLDANIIYVRPHGNKRPGIAVMRNIRDFAIENGFDRVIIDNAYI